MAVMDKLKEECGVFGIFSKAQKDVARIAYSGLFALQHRGQESCGIAVNDGGVMTYHCDKGLIADVLTEETLTKLGSGNIAVGHVRYGTTGNRDRRNAQPIVMNHIKGCMALAHNGNLVNDAELRRELELTGSVFHTTSDSEVIAYWIVRERLSAPSIEAAVEKAMDKLVGAYSLTIMSPTKLIAVRDPKGMRPLCIGRLGEDYVFASESCALESIGAKFLRDVEAGEIVIADKDGLRSIKSHCGGETKMCVFEFMYFARPDSVIEGSSVHLARQRAGAFLALEHPVQADVVIGVPDSGIDAAIGYARQSGIPYGIGLIKNKYIGRTFIAPTQNERERTVRLKLNPVTATVSGKRVVLIDDSIVRGTTIARIIGLLREAGAKEVHVRSSAPKFLYPCYFGTDIDSSEHLIAYNHTDAELLKLIGADSLGFLSPSNAPLIADNAKCGFCCGCFTGEYPYPTPDRRGKNKYETKLSEKENAQ